MIKELKDLQTHHNGTNKVRWWGVEHTRILPRFTWQERHIGTNPPYVIGFTLDFGVFTWYSGLS